jgi:hypothetical protein
MMQRDELTQFEFERSNRMRLDGAGIMGVVAATLCSIVSARWQGAQ